MFASYRVRLKKMIRLRLDRRLQGRLDASDVLQEAFLDIQKKADEFASREMTGYLWLRLITAERLLALHRHHLSAQMRDAAQEVSLHRGGAPAATTHSLANLLLGRLTSPTEAAVRAERQLRLQEALNGMDALDREILALRHFEELSNSECAAILDLSKQAASNRYIRALKRLKEILLALPSIDPNVSAGRLHTSGRNLRSFASNQKRYRRLRPEHKGRGRSRPPAGAASRRKHSWQVVQKRARIRMRRTASATFPRTSTVRLPQSLNAREPRRTRSTHRFRPRPVHVPRPRREHSRQT